MQPANFSARPAMICRGITIVGAGLAGSELALQLADRGFNVRLIDQKPSIRNDAQHSGQYCELVCSNSFRGSALTNAVGLLKEEMRLLGSHILKAADTTKLPAGGALAVDRDKFSQLVSQWLREQPRITLEERRVDSVPTVRPVVIATGPLTDDALAMDLQRRMGRDRIAYYDAIAPIIAADSIDWARVFVASRWDKGSNDQERHAYVNCPLERDTYFQLVEDIRMADKVPPRAFENPKYFEGCLPVEVMVERGERTLAFGPLKPVGLIDPRTSKRPFAVVQLRMEDSAGTAYNIVGFQTRMTHAAQLRIIRSIPGLENAQIERFGSVHRNTFIDSPQVLDGHLRMTAEEDIWFAGQITGVEGYVESAACGLVASLLIDDAYSQRAPNLPPETSALGSLVRYLSRRRHDFQPSNVNFALFPPLPDTSGKRSRVQRSEAMAERALGDLSRWWSERNAGSSNSPTDYAYPIAVS
jgi:methylenetetrahydrofolate--tRNA-(uracil-5-)-methyltransferase